MFLIGDMYLDIVGGCYRSVLASFVLLKFVWFYREYVWAPHRYYHSLCCYSFTYSCTYYCCYQRWLLLHASHGTLLDDSFVMLLVFIDMTFLDTFYVHSYFQVESICSSARTCDLTTLWDEIDPFPFDVKGRLKEQNIGLNIVCGCHEFQRGTLLEIWLVLL